MRKSLTFKLFFTLLVSFLLVIIISVSLLFTYFQFFYEDEKISRVIDSLNSFSNEYQNEEFTNQQLYQRIANFNNINGIDLGVFDNSEYQLSGTSAYAEMEYELTKSNDSYYYVTTVNRDSYYDFMLTSDEYQTLRSFENFKNSDGVYVKGYIDSYNFIVVDSIDNISVKSAKSYLESLDMGQFQSFEGNVVILSAQEIFTTNLNIDESGELFFESGKDESTVYDETTNSDDVSYSVEDFYTNEVGSIFAIDSTQEASVVLQSFYLEDYNFETKEKEGVTYTISHIPYTNYDQVSFSKIVRIDDKDIEFYASLSMQPVGEIIEIITGIIPYFLIGSLILAIIIAFFYSRNVSKPIVEITRVADQMANMDLDIVSTIQREDELGRLSHSLNTLASNLRGSMDELVMKNKQLAYDVEVKKMQEEARKAFVANASHELKTPLGIIKSYTEAINDGIKEEKKEYYKSVINDEIAHMDKLILEMLELSKFDAGVVKYDIVSLNMDSVVQSIIMSLKQQGNMKQMMFNIKNPLGRVLGDKEKIHQVVANLVSNAIKYGQEKTEIRIESIVKSKTIEFYVYNQCELISDKELEKIWERFYKIDTSHNRNIEGNGLGLSIVKSILEGHQSKFGVYNTFNGICVYFSLELNN